MTLDSRAGPTVYPDPNLTDHIVCVAAMALIINPEVNITALNTQQIINIYTGVTTNWKDVGGPKSQTGQSCLAEEKTPVFSSAKISRTFCLA